MRSYLRDDLLRIFKQYIHTDNLEINKADDIKKIVSGQAYIDMTPRTIKGINKDTIKVPLCSLSTSIYDYFNKEKTKCSQEEFDKWHKKTCNEFINNVGSDAHIHLMYGKAQKIVNMTFKYLYCFSDAAEFEDKFDYCHMAIDSYTLDWFIEEVIDSSVSVTQIRNTSWGKLTEGDAKSLYSYFWIQDLIQKNLKKTPKYKDKNGYVSAFKAEFYIWQERKLMSALDIIKNLTCNEDYPKYGDSKIIKELTCAEKSLKKWKAKFITQ